MVTSLPPHRPGCDRAVVEDEAGYVEPARGHHGGGDGLVAAHQAYEPVEQVSASNEFNRVGDYLAADERGAHSLRAHRNAVGDRDRVELHRRGPRCADSRLHVSCELALVEVAWHRFDPCRGHTDDGTSQVLIGEADRLQHGARRGAVGSVSERGARSLCRIRDFVVRVAHGTRTLPSTWPGVEAGGCVRSAGWHRQGRSGIPAALEHGGGPDVCRPSSPRRSRCAGRTLSAGWPCGPKSS